MPTINLTNNTTLNIDASAADGTATLNKYLQSPLKFLTPAGLDSIADQQVGSVDPATFPLTASATGAGKFAVKGTSLSVKLGATASLGLLKGDNKKSFLESLALPNDPAVAAIVSFELQGTLSTGDTATLSDFCFGVTNNTTVSLTSYCTAAATDTISGAIKQTVTALTIPHDIADLKSLPANAMCQIDASSSLKFTASVTYNVLNDPLATKSIPNLPSITVNATAGATVEAAATHTSDHTVTIAKLPNGKVHLAVSLTKTDDFETSLTVSAGVTADVGSTDGLAFLLKLISPNSTTEIEQLKKDMPPAQVQQLGAGIKAAIDAAVSSSLQVSLKAALDGSKSNNQLFLYEIDLTALDGDSTAALQAALTGDFTAITRPGTLAGVKELDSALTVTSKRTHSLALHLLGIFNWGSTNTFIEKSKIDYTKDTHEIVLSDEVIEIATNNLDADKLRQVVVQGITLTLPASANTPDAKTPINLVFFERQAAASPGTMRQFVNVLEATGAQSASQAQSLLNQKLKNYGASSLYLGLNLTPPQCRQLFIDSTTNNPHDQSAYIQSACSAEAIILAGDNANADRLKLYTAGAAFWAQLEKTPAQPDVIRLLAGQGIRQNAVTDVITVLWWSGAMAKYAKALAQNESLVDAGKGVVKDGTAGFNEPWLLLAAWSMLGKPAVDNLFTSSLLQVAATSPGTVSQAGGKG
jgi:hypothetical protein